MNLPSDSPLRIGILGAAKIARLFVEAVRTSGKVLVAEARLRLMIARVSHRLRVLGTPGGRYRDGGLG